MINDYALFKVASARMNDFLKGSEQRGRAIGKRPPRSAVNGKPAGSHETAAGTTR